MRPRALPVFLVCAVVFAGGVARGDEGEMAAIPAGTYRPLYAASDVDGGTREAAVVQVAPFWIDRRAASNGEFLDFARANPRWRRSSIPRLFADGGYLAHWRGDFDLGGAAADAPVVNVSWFAARAYCAWRGKKLPTVAQWERAAAADETREYADDDDDFRARVLEWHARPVDDSPRPRGESFRNVYGVYDLHGLVWEWTRDFNNALVTGASRSDSGVSRNLFCGGGAAGAADFEDYGAFMRFAFRGSLRGDYAVSSLGFRCAREAPPPSRT